MKNASKIETPRGNKNQLPNTQNNELSEQQNAIRQNEFAQFMIKANLEIRQSGKPNYLGPRIPIFNNWNLKLFENLLANYHDKRLVQFLAFGWPLGHKGCPLNHELVLNHKGARENPAQVFQYLENETKKCNMIGPFEENPFVGVEPAFSPLNALPKKNTDEKRIISDCSFPDGKSVNDGLDKEIYEGEVMGLRYPTIDALVKMIHEQKSGCLLFKTDFRKFFRMLKIDPGEIHLLGLNWENSMYFDCSLVMGLCIAPYIAQRVSNAIAHMYREMGYDLANYIDDLASAREPTTAWAAFFALKRLLSNLRIEEAESKCVPPSTNMDFLGINADTVKMLLTIPEEKLAEIKCELSKWKSKDKCTLKELQSIIGRLTHAASCVVAGRLFYSRMLNFLREFDGQGPKNIPQEVIQDIDWWRKFMAEHNGVSMMLEPLWLRPGAIFTCDSCLTGLGSWCTDGDYFHETFPEHIANLEIHINELELLTIVVALKTWSAKCAGKRILIKSDNENAVQVINKGTARNKFSQACLRELCFVCGKISCTVKIEHYPGKFNLHSDLLSRFHLDPINKIRFAKLTANEKTQEVKVKPTSFQFQNKW